MTELTIIPLKNNLLNDWKKSEVKKKIIGRINELQINNPKYKNDNEFLVLVCNLIEFLIVKKDNIDKKDLCVGIFSELFGITQEEEEILKHNISFIHSNKSIKKVSAWKLFKVGCKEYFNGKK